MSRLVLRLHIDVSINDILASDPIKEWAVELGPLPETIIEHIDLAIVAIKKDARVNTKSIQNFDALSESSKSLTCFNFYLQENFCILL